jgi:hypothetical protein
MFRKTIVIAMAAGAMAALALPSAAGANWKHHNTDIQQNVTVNKQATSGSKVAWAGSNAN